MGKKRKITVTVSIKVNRDGSMAYKSTGGFDLRKLFPRDFGIESTTAGGDRADPASSAEKEGA